jgi:hypothetical protein
MQIFVNTGSATKTFEVTATPPQPREQPKLLCNHFRKHHHRRNHGNIDN